MIYHLILISKAVNQAYTLFIAYLLICSWCTHFPGFDLFEIRRKNCLSLVPSTFQSILTHLSRERPEAEKLAAPIWREGGSGRPSPNRWALSGQSMCEQPFHPRLSWSPGCLFFFQLRKHIYSWACPNTHDCTHTHIFHYRFKTHARDVQHRYAL